MRYKNESKGRVLCSFDKCVNPFYNDIVKRICKVDA